MIIEFASYVKGGDSVKKAMWAILFIVVGYFVGASYPGILDKLKAATGL